MDLADIKITINGLTTEQYSNQLKEIAEDLKRIDNILNGNWLMRFIIKVKQKITRKK